MGTLVRKNLVLDADGLRELAKQRGQSESALVRELVHEELTHVETKQKMADALARFDAWLDQDVEVEDQAASAAP